jgi:hypothetical protein
MEENKLFNELYFIKYQIQNDLNILKNLQNDLKLKNMNDTNKNLLETICLVKSEYQMNLEKVEKENLNYIEELAHQGNIIVEKENQIKILKEKLSDFAEENKIMNFKFVELKSNLLINTFCVLEENIKLINSLDADNKSKEIEVMNKVFLKNYFENKYK